MPVRIYDISKKLGLENKQVLSKAKELGIAGARVASSSLDKITAEYLEEQLRKDHPNLAQPAAAPVAAIPPTPAEPIVVVSAPPPPPPPEVDPQLTEPQVATATAVLEPEPVIEPKAKEIPEKPAHPIVAETPPAPPPPRQPPPPAGPKVGEKVGFIQLPTR